MEQASQVTKLRGSSNWSLWKFQVLINAESRHIDGHLLGTKVKPELNDKSNAQQQKEFETWKTTDSKAKELIVSRLEDEPMVHILSCQTAAEMWARLLSVYELKSETSIHLLHESFFNYQFKNQGVAAHISGIVDIVTKLRSLGETISDKQIITKILMSLPSHLNYFISSWESLDSSKQSINELTSRLIIEEQRLNSRESSGSNSHALTSQSTYECVFCGKNHPSHKCFKNPARKSENNVNNNKCEYCKKFGHVKKDCRFRISKEKSYKYKQQNSGQYSKSIGSKSDPDKNAYISVALVGEEFSSTKHWFLDSGASQHMTPHRNLFATYKSCTKFIKIGDGRLIEAIGVGNVDFTTIVDNNPVESVLLNVLHVPDLKMNLFSVSQALSKGHTLIGKGDTCQLVKNNKVFSTAKLNGNVFILENIHPLPETAAIAVNKESLETWHKRLAHQNVEYVKTALSNLNIDYLKNDFSCEACKCGKIHRLPFKSSVNRSKEPCHLIHVDLCGPMEVSSIGGSNYFLLFKDDFSHYRFVYPIKYKTEVPGVLKKFLALAENDTGRKVKTLRSDHGTEILNEAVTRMLEDAGIRHQLSAPYCPEQNGRIEREMRTVVEAARTMLIDAGLDKRYWAEAVATAVYVLNLTGRSSVKDKSPHELWFNKQPNLKHLRIFGEGAVVHVPDQRRQKWDPKGKHGIFVGYEPDSKAYRIYITAEDKVVISRNVIFSQKISLTQQKSSTGFAELFPDIDLPDNEEQQMENQVNCDYNSTGNENSIVNVNSSYSDESPESSDHIEEETEEKLGRGCRKKIPNKKYDEYVLLSFSEATTGDDSHRWREAIEEEKNALLENETWKLVDQKDVKNKKILTSRWVFKVKDDGRYKARLVVRGCQQREGIDYTDIFSPVIGSDALRLLLAYAAKKDYSIMKFDVKGAFLYGTVNEELYMQLPEGFETSMTKGKICKLQKSLYGLKQAPARWNERLKLYLSSQGFRQLKTEQCIFVNNERSLYLGIHVDDGILAGSNKKDMLNLLIALQEEFKITYDTDPQVYLGINIEHQDGQLKLSQPTYAEQIVEKYRMSEAKPTYTPLTVGQTTTSDISTDQIKFPFQEAVGSLLYLSTKTRPDLAFAVGLSGRHVQEPQRQDCANLKRTLKYVNTSKDLGIFYKMNNPGDNKLIAFCDADFAGDATTRRSTTGFVIFYNGGPVSWASRRQPIVATSSTEAEYIAAAEATKNLLYMKSLLEELSMNPCSIELNIDNKSAIDLIKNGIINRRSKHIDVRFHFIKETVEKGLVINYCPTENQIADIFTKPLNAHNFVKFKNKLVH